MTTTTTAAPQPLPVTIISGYLGAGKTTLVNAILSGDHGLRIAVLVNDFGSVAIDETLIAGRDGDVVALANGCMCCQIGGDLYDAVDRILRMRERFDHLLIETSGVADPSKISQIAVAEPDLDLARTVVLVDAVNFGAVLEDPRLRDTLLRQICAADLILLTKAEAADAISGSDLQMMFAEAGAAKPMAVLEKGAARAWHILEKAGKAEGGAMRAGPLGFHSLPFESWSWRGEACVERDDLVSFAENSGLNIYRLKGRLRLKDGKSIIVHKVGAEIVIEEIGDDFETSELVAIGARPEFVREELQAAWEQLIR